MYEDLLPETGLVVSAFGLALGLTELVVLAWGLIFSGLTIVGLMSRRRGRA